MRKRSPAVAWIATCALLIVTGALLWLLIAQPVLAAPVESVAAVLGAALTAFAAFSAWRAAEQSRTGVAGALRMERETLRAELVRLNANTVSDEYYLAVETEYAPDSPRAVTLKANIAEYKSREHNVHERIAEIDAYLKD